MTGTDRWVIIVADGDVDATRLAGLVDSRRASTERPRPLVIAADGGAAKALAAGLRPDVVIGDGDSLPEVEREHLEAIGVEVRRADVDKDESDSELCLLAALEAEATLITFFGALGGERPEVARPLSGRALVC